MSLEKLYIDYSVEIAPNGHKHSRKGWINCPCPHCNSSGRGYHLGYNVKGNYFHCYHCGRVGINYTISKLTNISLKKVNDLLKDYNIKESSVSRKNFIRDKKKFDFELPNYLTELNSKQKLYLKHRGFNISYLENIWGVQGCSPFSMVIDRDSKIVIPYSYRVLAPIYWNGQLVSFQARDYTDRQEPKYKACPVANELINHQHILYGLNIPNTFSRRKIIVEGITDVWRFLGHAAATFGISYTPEQLRIMNVWYDDFVIIYDPEYDAQKQARKLKVDLLTRGKKVENIVLDSDPGDLSQSQANKLLKTLKFI